MPLQVKENTTMVSPYFLFFLIHATQTGIGVLKFQSEIIRGAGQDAWLSVLAMGLSLHIVFLMMLHIMRHSSQGDLISFHKDLFGKFAGGILNILVVIYFWGVGLASIQSYIHILQIWVFDGIGTWEFSFLICLCVYYIVSGGFRLIAGIAFWGVIIPSFLLLSFIQLFRHADYTYIMPFFNHEMKDYLLSAKESGFMFLGLEPVFVFLPFIKNGQKSSKWGHMGILCTTILYLAITIVTFMYYTQGKLQHLSWPTLSMIKSIQLPFLERFEFIFIFTWLLVFIPVVCTYLWSSVRIIKRTFRKLTPTFILFLLLGSYFMITSTIEDILFKQMVGKVVSYSGLVFLYGYIPFLFIISLIKSMIGKRKAEHQSSESVL
jgi:spore germination protein (amino acid permease)